MIFRIIKTLTDGTEVNIRDFTPEIHGDEAGNLAKQFVKTQEKKGHVGYSVKEIGGRKDKVKEPADSAEDEDGIDSYDQLSMPELKEQATLRGIEFPGNISKPKIIALLEKHDEAAG